MSHLQEHLTPSLLQILIAFWFSHLSEQELIAPPKTAAMKWFKRDDDFDKACVSNFGPCLEAIRSTPNLTADDLISSIDTSNSLHWIALVLLLDQIPRNTYRGDQAKTAFTFFDPLAQQVVQRALEAGVFNRPDLRAKIAHRCWFLFPLMHSEDVELHRRGEEMCEELVGDAKGLEGEGDRESATRFAETLLDFERRHQKIVERFGRYPHRNKVMGREMTDEEEAYLRDGGETFGG